MRWWCSLLIASAACYRPSGVECTGTSCVPDGGVDGDGPTPDGAGDAPPDVPVIPSTCETVTFPQPNLLLASAESYTTDGTIAIYESTETTKIMQTVANSMTAGLPIDFIAMPVDTMRRPRLSPDGTELYMLGVVQASASAKLMKSVPSGAKWGLPVDQLVTMPINHFVGLDFLPGVPSNTTPRRMVAGRDNSGTLYDGVEDSPNKWTFTLLSFPNFNLATEPWLSPDGKTLIFVGQNGVVGVYRVNRPSVTQPFGTPELLFNFSAGQEHFPAMSPDCANFYLTSDDQNLFRAQP